MTTTTLPWLATVTCLVAAGCAGPEPLDGGSGGSAAGTGGIVGSGGVSGGGGTTPAGGAGTTSTGGSAATAGGGGTTSAGGAGATSTGGSAATAGGGTTSTGGAGVGGTAATAGGADAAGGSGATAGEASMGGTTASGGAAGAGGQLGVGGSGAGGSGAGTAGTAGSGTAGAGGGAVSGACAPALPHANGKSTVTIQSGGTNRSYILYIPSGYDGTQRLPLVFDVHGYTSWAEEQLQRSKWDEMADQEGFVLINPDGVNESWNAGSCCGGNSQNDVGFFRDMVTKATEELCIDSKRVYVSGHSNGGAMTYRLACEAADIFAAVAPVCGWMTVSSCNPSRPVPVLAIRSKEDSTVRIDTADADIDEWLSNNQCSNTPVTTSGVCKTYTSCAAGAQLMDCRPRGNHNFFYSTNPDNYLVPDNAWPFFKQFSLP